MTFGNLNAVTFGLEKSAILSNPSYTSTLPFIVVVEINLLLHKAVGKGAIIRMKKGSI